MKCKRLVATVALMLLAATVAFAETAEERLERTKDLPGFGEPSDVLPCEGYLR